MVSIQYCPDIFQTAKNIVYYIHLEQNFSIRKPTPPIPPARGEGKGGILKLKY